MSWLAALSILTAAGRPPQVMTIDVRPGGPTQDILAGTTFGPLVSHDGGTTWSWYCPQAVGYGGLYDPDYAYSASGTMFAPTFNGFAASRDGCTFAPTTLGTTFVSVDALGSDGALHVAASDPADAKIYTSTDDGMTFPTMASPGVANDWWDSLRVAPSDPMRVYLSGYRLAATTKTFLVFASTTGGASFAALPTTDFVTSNNSTIDIAGVDPTSPDIVYAHVTIEDGNIGDGIYRSDNAGQSWTKILDKQDPLGLAFLVRGNGDLVAGTQSGGLVVSHDRGATWSDVACSPHPTCLVEASGVVWACSHEFAGPSVVGDGYAIMKSADLASWVGVLHFRDIVGPVACPAGTVQHDTCAPAWPNEQAQLAGSSAPPLCPVVPDAGAIAPDAMTPPVMHEPGGCCSTGTGGGSALLAGLVVIVLRRRR